MKKLLIGFLAVVLLVGVFGQMAEAARWEFHYWLPNTTTLTVYGTINCHPVGPPLFQGTGVKSTKVSGWVPPWCNDYMTFNAWAPGYTCGNVDTNKVAVKYYDVDRWRLYPLAKWIADNVPISVVLPTMGDSTGVIRYVHLVVDLAEWLADPRPLQDEYTITNGVCPDLPGYLIGTTPIIFDSLAGSGQNPFQTTPLTGTLYRDGDITFTPQKYIPTFTQWGLIGLMLVLLAIATWVFFWRKKALRGKVA